jgi:hypothetical protein
LYQSHLYPAIAGFATGVLVVGSVYTAYRFDAPDLGKVGAFVPPLLLSYSGINFVDKYQEKREVTRSGYESHAGAFFVGGLVGAGLAGVVAINDLLQQ